MPIIKHPNNIEKYKGEKNSKIRLRRNLCQHFAHPSREFQCLHTENSITCLMAGGSSWTFVLGSASGICENRLGELCPRGQEITWLRPVVLNQEQFCPSGTFLAMLGDVFGCHRWGEGTALASSRERSGCC